MDEEYLNTHRAIFKYAIKQKFENIRMYWAEIVNFGDLYSVNILQDYLWMDGIVPQSFITHCISTRSDTAISFLRRLLEVTRCKDDVTRAIISTARNHNCVGVLDALQIQS